MKQECILLSQIDLHDRLKHQVFHHTSCTCAVKPFFLPANKTKMAADNKIAKELNSSFNRYSYNRYCQYLTESDAVNYEHFSRTDLGKSFWIDLRRCFNSSGANPNHVLEIFGQFSAVEADILRQQVLDIVKEESDSWESAGRVVLNMKFTTLDMWLDNMEKPTTHCDEFMLYVLNKIHYRHTVVYTKNRSWSTVHVEEPMSPEELHRVCDVHLVYLGEQTYRELRRLPMVPGPKSPFEFSPIINIKGKGRQRKPLDLSVKPTKTRKERKSNCISEMNNVSRTVEMDNHDDDHATPNVDITADRKVQEGAETQGCFNQSDRNKKDITSSPVVDSALTPGVVNSLQSLQVICSSSNQDVPTLHVPDVPVPGNLDGTMKSSNIQNLYKPTPEPDVPEPSNMNELTTPAPVTPKNSTGKPIIILNLRQLSSAVVRKTFPGMDPIMIAKAYDTKNLRNPDKLAILCVRTLSLLCTPKDIDKLVGDLTARKEEEAKATISKINYPEATSLDDYMKSLALKRIVSVVVPKLGKETVQLWTKTHWSNIDPYSDIEVVDDTSDQSTSSDTDLDKSAHVERNPHFDIIGGRILRKRKRSYSSDRQRRQGSATKFYRDMCVPDTRKRRNKPTEGPGPSADRIKSQEIIRTSNKNRRAGVVKKEPNRSYPVFQPKKPNRKNKPPKSCDAIDTAEDDTPEHLPPEPKREPKCNDDSIVIECSVKTKTYGLPKRKQERKVRIRSYKCQGCDKTFSKVSLLNEHYKDSHPPVQCKTCGKDFCTPSTLERHTYIHGDLKFKCGICGIKFPFKSMRDSHLISHQDDHKHKCKQPKCGKKFFNKGDLVKHEKVHDDKEWKCILCKYTNPDQRNLKAHMRVHSNLKPYICTKCGKLFKYHQQLSRHLPCKDHTTDTGKKDFKPARSHSPEF